MRIVRLAVSVFVLAMGVALAGPTAHADVSVSLAGAPKVVFDTSRDGCAPIDVPDLNPRAYRDANGQIVMFALHYVNRPLRGPDFDHLKIDCHVSLDSPLDADPAHYADRNFVAATWTEDGRHVSALVHHEYHADDFHRCNAVGELACWYNSVLAYRSGDGGENFTRSQPLIVAAAPFRQNVGQGRHRGFFNPSNIVEDGGFLYALISTTGWNGQPYGNCLFRRNAAADKGWWAYDGTGFTIRYEDPYRAPAPSPRTCATIEPFTFAVGAIVRHVASKTWIAVTQASAGGAYPLDGFYYATSPDLRHWSAPRLLLPGKTLYGDLCKAGPSIINYPALLDPASPRRNFDQVGDHPELMFTRMAVADCAAGQRLLVRQGLTIETRPGSKS